MFLTIKRAILSRLTPSDESKLETLLSGLDLGDNRPSDLLRRITALAGTNFSQKIIKTFWIRKLSEVLRLTLVAQSDTMSLDELSNTADKIFDAMNRSSRIAAMEKPSISNFIRPPLNNNFGNNSNKRSNSRVSTPAQAPTLESIMTRLDVLGKKLNVLTNQRGGGRTRSRTRTNSNQRRDQSNSGIRKFSNSFSNPGFNGAWCVMHNRWKHKAHYCNQPCTFLKDNQLNLVTSDQTKNE